MMSGFEKFILIRKWSLIISQIFGSLFCIYFISQVQEYEVTSNLLKTMLPSVANKINTLLSSVGTYILLLPLSIILLAFLFPEIKSLKLLSSFFGILGTLFMVISSLFKNKITAVYNMKLFIVTKILSLEEKKIIFKAEYTRIINEQYQKNMELYNKLQEKLLEKHFITYDEVLIQLKDKLEIKIYVNEVILKLVKSFITEKNIEILGNKEKLIYYGSYVIVGIVCVFVVAGVIRYFVDSAPVEGAKLMRETAVIASENNQSTINLQEITAEVIRALKEEYLVANIIPAQLVNEAVTKAFAKVGEKITKIEDALDIITDAIKTD